MNTNNNDIGCDSINSKRNIALANVLCVCMLNGIFFAIFLPDSPMKNLI